VTRGAGQKLAGRDGVTIRPMRPADAAVVIAMAHELAAHVGDPPPTFRESDFVKDGTGAQPWFECLVAEIADEIVGYAIACRGFEAHTGKKRLWLADLYVRPAARRIGAGNALIAAIARHALALGCDAVYWELWRKNAAGEAFYRRLAAEEARELALMRFDKNRLAAIVAQQSHEPM
jgi:GNAT superfamily N-acetyltransferase